jgi:hypothetical protein
LPPEVRAVTERSRRAAPLLLFVGLSLNAQPFDDSAEEARPPAGINVRIFNYAGVERSVFSKARREASRIFSRSGVEINWIECAASTDEANNDLRCTARMGPSDLLIRVLAGPMTGFESHGELGVALIPAGGGFGSRASVFQDKIRDYCERWQASQGLLLGHTIAHEMGHLLLGANSHSGGGIMRAPWNRRTLEMAGVGTLLFSDEEGKRMRRQVAERIRAYKKAQENGRANWPARVGSSSEDAL